MKKQEFWNIENVATFRGFDVTNGEVDLSESEFQDYLDEIYGTVEVMGMTYGAGNVLSGVDPVAFRCAQGDYENELQTELEEQLENEDSSNIEFVEGDEFEVDEEEDDE